MAPLSPLVSHCPASKMTDVVSAGKLNSTRSLIQSTQQLIGLAATVDWSIASKAWMPASSYRRINM